MKVASLFLALLLQFVISLYAQPTISFTFDDGDTGEKPGYTFDQWNTMLLDHLDQAGVKTIFFVTGNNKGGEKGQRLLKSWDERGHGIANHTFSHLNYNKQEVTFDTYQREFLRQDSLIKGFRNYTKLFRFPYLKEGNTKEKIDSFRKLMDEHGYQNGHVTIDGSDWYIDSRLRQRLRAEPDADIEKFKQFYLEHLFSRASYYEELAFTLTGRHIHHTLLLHHNLAAALFVDDLIAMFREKGWKIVDAKAALEDPIFSECPTNVPAGESLIWALAKQSGKFESLLRYPAEDGAYEKDRMDQLGL